MKTTLHRSITPLLLLSAFVIGHSSFCAEVAKPPPPRYIEPGETRRDIATQKPRGELLSYDPATRRGTFKATADGATREFIALPHVLCQHHCAIGDMRDYRIGERLRFILHESKGGQWNLLGAVSEELSEIVAHDEPYFVDAIDAAKRILTCTRRNRAGDKIVWPGMTIRTDGQTRYWRNGKPEARFEDVTAGMPLWIKTHDGSGLLDRIAWDIFLDDASIETLKQAQTAAHHERLAREGLPGYMDTAAGSEVRLTLFTEAMSFILNQTGLPKGAPGAQRGLKPRQSVHLSLAGPDRVARGEKLAGKITTLRPYIKLGSYICEVTVALDAPMPAGFRPAAVARLWPLPTAENKPVAK
jgi:hypothetical protein